MPNTSSNSIELLKHRLALDLETRKWQYRSLELQYIEAGQNLRSLNQLMWQVPSMVIAITGGLWYGATTVEELKARTVVLSFAAVFGLLAIGIIWRLRQLIQIHIERQDVFSQKRGKPAGGKYGVISCWTTALIFSSLVSILGAFNPMSLSKKQTPPVKPSCCAVQINLFEQPAECPATPGFQRQPSPVERLCVK